MDYIMLTVMMNNDAALKLYNKIGYVVDETSPVDIETYKFYNFLCM